MKNVKSIDEYVAEHNFRCRCLRMDDNNLRRAWYKIKKAEYSDKQPKKRAILQFWYETGATPFNCTDFDKEYKNICDNLSIPQVDNVEVLLSDLYERFAKYAFKERFKSCVKYHDGSLKLYQFKISGRIAYKTEEGDFIALYDREPIYWPEKYFTVFGEALAENGMKIPVRKHMLEE